MQVLSFATFQSKDEEMNTLCYESALLNLYFTANVASSRHIYLSVPNDLVRRDSVP